MMIGDDTRSGGAREFGTGSVDSAQVTDARQHMHPDKGASHVNMGAATGRSDKGTGKPDKVRLAICVLLVLLALGILSVALLPSKKESPSQPVVEQERDKPERTQDAALKHEISAHFANGKQFLERRDYVQAQNRFKRVLELAPDNAEAQSLLAEVESRLKKGEERNLQTEQHAREIREKLSPLFTEANVLFATRDYAKALEILLQARELAPDNPDVIKLQAEVEQALEAQHARQEEQAVQQDKALAKVKRSHEKAMRFRDEKQPYHALREFMYLLSLDVESEETDAARRLVPELEQQLLEMTRKDFTRGEELLAKDKPTEALQAWRAVLDVFPDHTDAKARIERLMPAISQKGKELYQEGLVYEDLGHAEMAVKKWLEAVDTLAIVPDDEYLGKAKIKLESYPSLVTRPRD